MANTDSFIEEVSEEVRRDRLSRLLRKWGWIAILAVVVIVGGAAVNEYRRAQETAAAQAFGDALIAALDTTETEARLDALSRIEAQNPQAQALLTLLQAGEEASAGEAEAAAARLRALAADTDLPARYRDLALLKAHLLAPEDSESALAMLDRLALPGRPYRSLALEQQAYALIEAGSRDQGVEILRLLEDEATATAGLQQRASQLIVALEAGATLADPAPEAAEDNDAGADAVAPAEEPDAGPDAAPGEEQ